MLKVWVRQSHRWLSLAFTLAVVANFTAMALAEPPAWIVYAPLPPLFLLMLTGLYMFTCHILQGDEGKREPDLAGHSLRPRRFPDEKSC